MKTLLSDDAAQAAATEPTGEVLLVRGGRPLRGRVTVTGAKNLIKLWPPAAPDCPSRLETCTRTRSIMHSQHLHTEAGKMLFYCTYRVLIAP